MESRHFKCAFEGNPEPIYLVGIWPSQTAACLRLRHPWCPDSKSTTIATATSGRNATYRNLLTQRETEERAWPRLQGCKMCSNESRAPHSTTSLREACNVKIAAGALKIAPTYASSVVTLQVYFPRSESPTRRRRRRRGCHKWVVCYRNPPTLRYLYKRQGGHGTIFKVAT